MYVYTFDGHIIDYVKSTFLDMLCTLIEKEKYTMKVGQMNYISSTKKDNPKGPY